MSAPEVFVVRDPAVLAEAVVARLVTLLVDRQAATGGARLLVDDHAVVADVLATLARSPARDAVDRQRIELWWTHRHLGPEGTGTASALDDAVTDWGLSPEALHRPDPTRPGVEPSTLAEEYAAALLAARRPDEHGPAPEFDVALLGVGTDGAVAGVYPEQPAVHDTRSVVLARSPSGPSVTMTLPTLAVSREVWLLARGEAVAPAVHLALSGAGPVQVPAAGLRGQLRTLLLADAAAARRIPAGLRRLASP